jgi:hypothetical protein
MARSRNIKPGFFKNEFLAQCSPYARLLFAGLWLLADRRGRLEDRPLKIKGELFPFESLEVDALLKELADSEGQFLTRYTAKGKAYIQIENFHKHQNPHKNETESTIPAFIKQNSSNGASDSIHYASDSDKTRTTPEKDLPTPADSLNPITDSLSQQSDADASVCVTENGLAKGTEEKSSDPANAVKSENDKLAEEGLHYLASLNSPNLTGIGWVKGYLGIQLQELEASHPSLSKQKILSVWRDVCDLAVSKNASAPQWLKTTFKNKLDRSAANTTKMTAPEPASGQAKALLQFSLLRHRVTGEVFKAQDLELRPESSGGLYHKQTLSFYPLAHLEGVAEVPDHA